MATFSSTSGSGEVAADHMFKMINLLSRVGLSSATGGITDISAGAIKKSQADIIRRKELLEGLESIKGQRLSPSQRKIKTSAKIQRYLQDMADDLDKKLTGTASAAVGGEITNEEK